MSPQQQQMAYLQAQSVTETPRQTEYRLFAQVTKALLDVDGSDYKVLARAVNWNRRLWLTLQDDCASDDNKLPDAVRAGIISLAIWVDKQSRDALRRQAGIDALIEVNRIIMDGLAQTQGADSENPAPYATESA